MRIAMAVLATLVFAWAVIVAERWSAGMSLREAALVALNWVLLIAAVVAAAALLVGVWAWAIG